MTGLLYMIFSEKLGEIRVGGVVVYKEDEEISVKELSSMFEEF